MNRYIQKLIKEQFNITDIDFDDTSDYDVNIFNKSIFDPYKIYDKILNFNADYNMPTAEEINFMSNLSPAVAPKNKDELRRIAIYYSQYNTVTKKNEDVKVDEILDKKEEKEEEIDDI